MTGRGNSTTGVNKSFNKLIDGLVTFDAWNDASVHYAFSNSGAAYSGYPAANQSLVNQFTQISNNQKKAAHFALDANSGPKASKGFSVEGFTGLKIVSDGSTNSSTAEIRFGSTNSNSLGTAQVTDFPGNYFGDVDDDGDVWFGTQYNYRAPQAGNYSWHTHLHEIGHALGIKHGHENSGYGRLPANLDTMEFTVMTYRSYKNAPLNGGYTNANDSFAQTYMMGDIAALQYMYGADFTTNGGKTVYKWTPNSGDTKVNGKVAIDAVGNKIFATIWDGNGIDTYDLSAYSNRVQIDLRPGKSSTFSDGQLANLGNGREAGGNIYNALQFNGNNKSLIENATGGKGNDKIVGNNATNKLMGGNGNDNLSGNKGNDKLVGGKGNDRLVGGKGNDKFVFGEFAGRDTIVDFNDGQDKLDLTSFGFSRKGAALKHFNEVGGANNDVLNFKFKGTDIAIMGIDMKDLSGADILI